MKKKKVRRVVLGEGNIWFHGTPGHWYDVSLFEVENSRKELNTVPGWDRGFTRVRLVAEVFE